MAQSLEAQVKEAKQLMAKQHIAMSQAGVLESATAKCFATMTPATMGSALDSYQKQHMEGCVEKYKAAQTSVLERLYARAMERVQAGGAGGAAGMASGIPRS